MSEERKQPWNDEAERGVLAGILLAPDIAVEAFARLTSRDFYDPRHGKIFETARAIDSRGEPVDLIMVRNELERLGETGAAGGNDYVTSLVLEDIPLLSNVMSYAGIVRDCSLLRQFLRVAGDGMDRVYTTNVKAAELLDQVSQKIFDIGTRASERDFVRVSDLSANVMDVFETMRNSPDGVTGLSTGLQPLDRLTTGFHGGEMNVIAARPGVGKTSLALNIARHIASLGRGTVAFFSLEMSCLQLTQRLVCSMAGVGTGPIIDGTLSERHLKDLYTASEKLKELPICINDVPAISSAEIRAKTRRLAQREKNGIAAVFVDYLQLMAGADDIESHQLKVAKNSSDLKALAKDMDVPVIVLSQLSRGAAKREGPPRLSDLRDSGAIEQDADVVMFLHDEHADSGDDAQDTRGDLRRILLKIAKQRKGQRGQINLVFHCSTTTFDPEESPRDWV
ncbi:MAG TPA: replicative DNA helicase [Candidatus Sabulitectum sp.]|nr:replicative DNA helicase [Candidatus Sabulitectum sp.]HPF31770.1 replicative DNA helicase [Candidatus Sabulitectum sp.]HPJ27376.1 replicative DNA helicase [Candidatus Sabulitectum sp.]HPR21067.1 replicative DNA helicase [Candidatus Sabulitectum sp.]